MYVLTLLFLTMSGAYSDSHTLHYYTTGVSAPGSGLIEFTIVGFLDDQQIDIYRSDTGRNVPVAQWMKLSEKPEYWEISTQSSKQHETLYKHEVLIIMERFKHTSGYHYVQVRTICELRDDGSTVGHQEYRYDGEEYMFYDTQTATFIPTMAEAQFTTQRWNTPMARGGEKAKNYLENTCIENLKRFIKYGKEALEQRVQPRVKVTGQKSGEVTKLHCQVYEFYPRAVDVKWMKNEKDEVPLYETTHVLPNPNGTYQIRVTVEVIPKEGDSYSCYVDHSSLEKPLLVKWEPTQDSSLAVIITVVIIALVIIPVTTGVIMYIKKKVQCSQHFRHVL